MTEELLKAILITSLAGSCLAMVITLLKPITKKLFGYKWHYYVWLAVLVVMILPVRFTILNTETIPTPIANTIKVQTIPNNDIVITDNNFTQPTVPTTITPQAPIKKSVNFLTSLIENRINILGIIWLIGILIMLSISVIGYLRLIHKVHKKSVIISCPEVKKYTKRKITVRSCESLSSPFIMGIFKPSLVLPNIELTAEQLENILMHEMTHFKRNDILYKWFATLVKALHWFNPIVYYIAKQINTECEISCDLSVVKDMDSTQEMTYVNTIISLLAVNKSKTIPLTTGMTGNKNMLKRRFTMIKNKKNTSKIMSALSALIAVVMLGTTVFASGLIANIYNEDAASVGIIGGVDGPTAVYVSEEIVAITKDGQKIELNNAVFPQNDELYFPLRETLEKLDFMENNDSYINWDNGKIDIGFSKKDYHDFSLEIGEKRITVEGDMVYEMHNAPVLIGSNTYVPFSYLRHMFKEPKDNIIITKNNGEILYLGSLSDEQMMFIGTIVENTLDTTTSAILVKPDEDSEIAYDTILFELTENQKEWVNKVGSKVQIVCYNSFQESLPPIGGLISIAEVKDVVLDKARPENAIDSNLPKNQMMFIGTIVENTLDTTTAAILVKPDEDSEITYDTILFELTENQKEWVNKVGAKVQIVCYNSFQESLPPIGGLISITEFN